MFNSIKEAITDLKSGKVIIVCDDENRENEGDFVALAEFATPAIINFLITHGKGLVCMPINRTYAEKFNLTPMVQNNTDRRGTKFTTSIDHVSTSTGISAFERSKTILEFISDNAKVEDFTKPGHIFPLVSENNGVLARAGHTEAAVDLANLCGSKPVGILCEIILENGQMARRDDLIKISQQFNLKIITIKDLIKYRKTHEELVKKEATANLPTKWGNFSVIGYSSAIDNTETTVLVKGNPSSCEAPYVRIHSSCLTGDVFSSLRCDCHDQLEQSIKFIQKHDDGIIIYLQQEGRGIGLLNKLKAYELQQNGADTLEANKMLGFPHDMRDYAIAAQILNDLGIKKVRLLTNNPEKISALEDYGISIVERIAVNAQANPNNIEYLKTKIKKLGHLINLIGNKDAI